MRRNDVAGFVLYRPVDLDIEYLLLRKYPPKCTWAPPKGHLEEDETALEAAVRETLEETGLARDTYEIQEGFCEVLKFNDERDRPKTLTFWLARFVKQEELVLSQEHEAFGWFKLEEVKKERERGMLVLPRIFGALQCAEEFLRKKCL